MNVLIDLDGTLTDPRVGFVASVNHALTSLGLPARPDDEIAARIGPPLEETLSALLGPAEHHQLARAILLYRERYSSSGIFQCSVYAGIPQALERLQSAGAGLFLATSKPQVFARRILDEFGLSRYFTAAYGCELDGTRSDKRQLIAHLLAQEALRPATCVMVGDRAQDVRGAKSNQLRSIGVLWGYGSRPELERAGADLIVREPAELADLIQAGGRPMR